jgi:hypothetical protein
MQEFDCHDLGQPFWRAVSRLLQTLTPGGISLSLFAVDLSRFSHFPLSRAHDTYSTLRRRAVPSTRKERRGPTDPAKQISVSVLCHAAPQGGISNGKL